MIIGSPQKSFVTHSDIKYTISKMLILRIKIINSYFCEDKRYDKVPRKEIQWLKEVWLCNLLLTDTEFLANKIQEYDWNTDLRSRRPWLLTAPSMYSGRYGHINETLILQNFAFIMQFYTYFKPYDMN